jgi:GntR family galactonate operon transcriptional repressor
VIDKRLYPLAALHGQVAHNIGRRIVSGGIREGEALPREAELSRQFAVSRQAVREALKVLAAKGLVTSRRRAGTHVVPRTSWNLLDPDVLAWHRADALPADFVRDLVELRRLIEPAAAEHAARRGDSKKIAQIGAALEDMRTAVDDRDRFFTADVEFHLAIFAASGNVLIDRLSTILGPLLEASFRMQRDTAGDPEGLVGIHNAVYDAIVEGDAPRARQAMESLLTTASDKASLLEAGRQ